MKKIQTFLPQSFLFSLILVVLIGVLQTSCKKEALPTFEITYALSGNFGKDVTVKYTPTEGTIATAEELVLLPWQKIAIPNTENGSVGLMVVGSKGLPGSEVTAKIFVNGIETATQTAIADQEGNLNLSINHIFD